jgi:hypothetical protein
VGNMYFHKLYYLFIWNAVSIEFWREGGEVIYK